MGEQHCQSQGKKGAQERSQRPSLHSWDGPKGPPSSTRVKRPEKQPFPSLTSLIRAIPVCLRHPHLTFMLIGSAWQHGGGRSALTPSPALCQPVWAVSCPSATAAQREPRDKGPLCGGSSQRTGGRVECVCEYFAELGKAPCPRPPGPQSFVCQGHNGDLQNACLGMTAGERVAEGGQGRLWGRRKAGIG